MAYKYDVIVVGAGPGGATCGALLAKWGLKTLLLDKNERVGGKVMGLPVKGFQGEMGPVFGVGATGGAWFEAFSQLGIESKLNVIVKSTGTMYRRRGGEWEIPGMPDPLGTDAKEREIAQRVLSDMSALTPEQLDDLDNVSVLQFLKRYGDVPSPLYGYFATMCNGLITSLIETVAMSEFVRVQRSLGTQGPSGYPKGGYGRMVEDMVEVLKASGGEVRTRAKIESIIVDNDRVTGVITKDRAFKAPIVVSNAGMHPTVFKLVGKEYFDKSYVNYVKDVLPSLGFTSVRYLLSRPVLPHGMYYVMTEDSWLDMERYNKLRAGEILGDLAIYMTIPSNHDPTMAPPGKQMLILGTWCSPDPEAKEIKMLQKRTDELLAEIFPEVVPAIEAKIGYAGPAQVSSLSRDQVLPGLGGEAVGLAVTVGQCGKHKPSAKSPLPGLFYVGHDAGGGSRMGTQQAVDSGMKVAQMVLQYHLERKQAMWP